jgi:anthranilate phosphoribosyltransferase
MIKDAIAILVDDEELTGEQVREVAFEILGGEASSSQIAAFITALRIRGESVEHLAAFASAMREKAQHITPPAGIVLDTCGTGGDAMGTFNVSTTAALIASAGGVNVAKHGNRAVSSKCGSADVLAELGVKIDASLDVMQRCLHEIGFCFLFAPTYHTAMKHAVEPRREVGIRSIFNMIGPLSNPAGATHQLVGVYKPELTETFAEVLHKLGVVRALVVHGGDGLDELTITSATQVSELRDGRIHTWTVAPGDFDIEPAELGDLIVESVSDAAELMRNILNGETGPCADMALLNAGAALYVAGKTASIEEGYALARDVVASGKAIEKLEALVRMTNAGQ